ncbi:GMC oxidoreductase [Zopfia rhizophila CBS 207.26]|uniref:GMC oxidoreductase n=1 Tax=Zopfia rhizophila CBS 207.26 TaxID=1314779 RepID=A0A6A6DPX3_9PEZI|nr:GMC oxidoreductase [Zopfia rhizophila CBS 207.26]
MLQRGVLLRFLSRGIITINTTDTPANPVVNFRTFANPIDVSNAIAMFRYNREYMSVPALQGLGPVEIVPVNNIMSDTCLEKALREHIMVCTFAHPSGTCSMIPEELGGLLDSEWRIYGTSRLSVVDACHTVDSGNAFVCDGLCSC